MFLRGRAPVTRPIVAFGLNISVSAAALAGGGPAFDADHADVGGVQSGAVLPPLRTD